MLSSDDLLSLIDVSLLRSTCTCKQLWLVITNRRLCVWFHWNHKLGGGHGLWSVHPKLGSGKTRAYCNVIIMYNVKIVLVYLFIYCHLYSALCIVQCSNGLYRLWDGEIQGHTGQPSVREIDAHTMYNQWATAPGRSLNLSQAEVYHTPTHMSNPTWNYILDSFRACY